jgi:dynein heavy chain
MAGEIQGTALANFRSIVSELYLPIVQEQQVWGKAPQDQTKEFVGATQKFGSMLSEAVTTVTGGVELKKPESKYVDQFDLKQAAYNQALADESASSEFEECLTEWCVETERLLAQTNKIKDGEEPGPDTELEYWRTRMSNFNSITEQLKNKDCKLVLGVCGTGKTRAYLRWKALDIQVTDAANEAKDNVKYLATLEKSLESMFHGTVQDITDTLPPLINNIRVSRAHAASLMQQRLSRVAT